MTCPRRCGTRRPESARCWAPPGPQGLVRDDLHPLEVVLGLGLITRPLLPTVAPDAPDLVPRMVEIVLAGMRPGS